MTVPETPFSPIYQRLMKGDLINASREITAWMELQPSDAGALTAHACLMRLRGRYPEAAAALDRSLAIAPEFAPTLIEVARIARHHRELERAHTAYEEAHRHAPKATEWFDEWHDLLLQTQRYAEAVQVAKRWCEAKPDLPKAWFSLGLCQQYSNAFADALAAYEHAMTLDADYPMLCNNLSALNFSMGDYHAALRIGDDAIRLDPNSALPWTNAANTWLTLREPDNALIAAERACAISPAYVSALLALGNVLKERRRSDEALDVMVRAAHAAPNDPKIQWSVAMLQLLHGDYENGFLNHEARWRGSPELGKTQFFREELRWRGEDFAGRTLLLWGEQGFGDAFQFIRFVPQIAESVRSAGGTVAYCCFSAVFPLFERTLKPYGVAVMPHNVPQLPAFDFHLPVGSLPLVLGVRPETLAAALHYLDADPAGIERWRSKLPESGPFKVGIVWSGNRMHQRNPLRSVSPAGFAQAFGELPGVEFYSLQIDGASDVAEMASQGLNVVDRTPELTSFDETAALISNLDLVITVCTSLAHLSGALGKRTWLLLDVNPHWVWMLDRSDSPWYPSLTLYRQQRYMDWAPVLRRVRTDLLNLIHQGR